MSPPRIASTVRREVPLLRDAVTQIAQPDVAALPVAGGDGGAVAGIVTREDFFRALAARLPAPP